MNELHANALERLLRCITNARDVANYIEPPQFYTVCVLTVHDFVYYEDLDT